MNGTAGVSNTLAEQVRNALSELEVQSKAESPDLRPRRGRPRGSLSLSNTLDVILYRNETFEPIGSTPEGLDISDAESFDEDSLRAPRLRLSMDFYRNILYGISSEISRIGLKMNLIFCRNLADGKLIAQIRKSRHRGILLFGTPSPTETGLIRKIGLPIVLVDVPTSENVPVVTIDNIGGIASIVKHLKDLGHRRIGFSGNDDNPCFRIRHIAFCGEMTRYGLSIAEDYSLLCADTMAKQIEEWMKVLSGPNPPTAIVCVNDNYAIAVVMAAQKLGLRIPEDISVTGFDNIEASERLRPSLTTVNVPTAEIGACAANLLLNLTGSPSDSLLWEQCEIRFRTSLVIRASTGPARTEPPLAR